jgi:hypothetical protein
LRYERAVSASGGIVIPGRTVGRWRRLRSGENRFDVVPRPGGGARVTLAYEDHATSRSTILLPESGGASRDLEERLAAAFEPAVVANLMAHGGDAAVRHALVAFEPTSSGLQLLRDWRTRLDLCLATQPPPATEAFVALLRALLLELEPRDTHQAERLARYVGSLTARVILEPATTIRDLAAILGADLAGFLLDGLDDDDIPALVDLGTVEPDPSEPESLEAFARRTRGVLSTVSWRAVLVGRFLEDGLDPARLPALARALAHCRRAVAAETGPPERALLQRIRLRDSSVAGLAPCAGE